MKENFNDTTLICGSRAGKGVSVRSPSIPLKDETPYSCNSESFSEYAFPENRKPSKFAVNKVYNKLVSDLF